MSHHSSDKPLAMPTELSEALERLNDRAKAKQRHLEETLGPTGDFPDGKIVPHDEGGLMFGVTVFNGRVMLDFGKPVRSIGFTREQAMALAEVLRLRAQSCPPIIGATKETT